MLRRNTLDHHVKPKKPKISTHGVMLGTSRYNRVGSVRDNLGSDFIQADKHSFSPDSYLKNIFKQLIIQNFKKTTIGVLSLKMCSGFMKNTNIL